MPPWGDEYVHCCTGFYRQRVRRHRWICPQIPTCDKLTHRPLAHVFNAQGAKLPSHLTRGSPQWKWDLGMSFSRVPSVRTDPNHPLELVVI